MESKSFIHPLVLSSPHLGSGSGSNNVEDNKKRVEVEELHTLCHPLCSVFGDWFLSVYYSTSIVRFFCSSSSSSSVSSSANYFCLVCATALHITILVEGFSSFSLNRISTCVPSMCFMVNSLLIVLIYHESKTRHFGALAGSRLKNPTPISVQIYGYCWSFVRY